MNKLLFVLICGCLMSTATVTVRAQSEYTIEQSTFIDSKLYESNLEIRKLALTRITDQNVFIEIALNDENLEMRKLALLRSTDQNVFKQIALEDERP